MNEKKIAFIICTNDDFYMDTCREYIEMLNVPDGYEVELLEIHEAKSMTSGYNEGREATDAKYKVYLHQDVFIVYKDFLLSMLEIFESDENIGMIGMVGAPKMPPGGMMWYGHREGQLYLLNECKVPYEEYQYELSHGLHNVQAVDGLLIATSKDVPWREDLFDAWDFYDVSQSFEYLRAGYKVVVPEQINPWTMHYDGMINLVNYDKYRRVCLDEYSEFFETEDISLDKQRTTNENKIAAIICTNNDRWFNECVKYLERVELPQGFSLDIVKVVDAASMATGYNEGMRRTDAKYKIYLHHDVFIVKKDFFVRVIDTFRKNEKIGLLGVLGGTEFVENASYWNNWNIGHVYACNGARSMLLSAGISSDRTCTGAIAVDGMLIMTQYDIPWREDLFCKWDFYDVSQCHEFRRKGYKVAVLTEANNEASTFHDCGFSKLENYEEGREIFCREYSDFGYEYGVPTIESRSSEEKKLIEECVELIEKMLRTDISLATKLAHKSRENWPLENRLMMWENILGIYEMEVANGIEEKFVGPEDSYGSLAAKFEYYKFLLRRLEFDINDASLEILVQDILEKKVSVVALDFVIHKCCFQIERVEQRLVSALE